MNRISKISISGGIAQAKAAYVRIGYPEEDFQIFGVRAVSKISNGFDDAICIVSQGKLFAWDATTDPGKPTLFSPVNSKGCAILKPGFYKDCWIIGTHNSGKKTAHTALVQRAGNVTVYRDNNRDNLLDMNHGTEDTGMHGINIHRASAYKRLDEVGPYSAGCQVFADPKDFERFLFLCKGSLREKFSYALFTEEEYF